MANTYYKMDKVNQVEIQIRVKDNTGTVYGVNHTIPGGLKDYDPRDISQEVEEKILVIVTEAIYGNEPDEENLIEKEIENEANIKEYEKKED
jgi:hypothetical protein